MVYSLNIIWSVDILRVDTKSSIRSELLQKHEVHQAASPAVVAELPDSYLAPVLVPDSLDDHLVDQELGLGSLDGLVGGPPSQPCFPIGPVFPPGKPKPPPG